MIKKFQAKTCSPKVAITRSGVSCVSARTCFHNKQLISKLIENVRLRPDFRSKIFKPILFLLLLLCVLNVDEDHRLKHQNHEELIQKCFVFLERRQRKWSNQRKLSTNHVFKRLFRFFTLDLKVRLIQAFLLKAELHNVVGYVYRFKRAAGGYARFLNSVVFQLVQKWYQNRSIYHGLEVREENLFLASFVPSFLASFVASCLASFVVSFLRHFWRHS